MKKYFLLSLSFPPYFNSKVVNRHLPSSHPEQIFFLLPHLLLPSPPSLIFLPTLMLPDTRSPYTSDTSVVAFTCYFPYCNLLLSFSDIFFSISYSLACDLIFLFVVLGLKPRASYMQGKSSTTELYPRSLIICRENCLFWTSLCHCSK